MMKDKLRNEMRARRRELSKEQIKFFSREIRERLFSLDLMKNTKAVCTFISAFNEPDTIEIIKRMLSAHIKTAVPVTNVETSTLTLSYIENMDNLKKGAYNISEPKVIAEAKAEDFDVVIVPGLAFDKNGSRMGFGKGYYDRLLENTSAVKIALCYSFQVFENIPSEEHDIPMDYIITEKEIIKIR